MLNLCIFSKNRMKFTFNLINGHYFQDQYLALFPFPLLKNVIFNNQCLKQDKIRHKLKMHIKRIKKINLHFSNLIKIKNQRLQYYDALYLGKKYRLILRKASQENIAFNQFKFCILLRNKYDLSRANILLANWYYTRAYARYRNTLSKYIRHINKHTNYKINNLYTLEIKSLKHNIYNFKYYPHTNKISINLDLIKMPKCYVDYCICIGICQIFEQIKSEKFYILLARLILLTHKDTFIAKL